jgi:hypothetical protein
MVKKIDSRAIRTSSQVREAAEDDTRDTFEFLASTCVAFAATTLVIVGQLLTEGNGRGVALIGGAMAVVNVAMTRHHYCRVKLMLGTREKLPTTASFSHENMTREVESDASRIDEADDPLSAHLGHKARHHRHRRPIDMLLSSSRIQVSPSRRKAARKAKKKRKKESVGRQGGLAGLGMGTRFIRL